MKAKLLVCLVIAFLTPIPLFSQVVDTTATVTSWNIEGFNPITDTGRIERLAQDLVTLDAEVIALQEVNPDAVSTQIVHQANMMGANYQDPFILPQPAIQNLAIVAKAGVTVANPRFIPGSDLGDPTCRLALAADVTIGRFDCTPINGHLKSKRSGPDRTLRDQQCQVIAAYVATIAAAEDDDVVLAGDYNMIPDDDDEIFRSLPPNGFIRFVSFHQAIRPETTVGVNFLDGYAITQNRMTEYVEGSVRIDPLNRIYGSGNGNTGIWFRGNVSDHFPLLARCGITRDAD